MGTPFRQNCLNGNPYPPVPSAPRRLAESLAEALKPVAKENQKVHGKTAPGRKNTSANIGESVDTREQAAKEAGVSHGSMATPPSCPPEPFKWPRWHADTLPRRLVELLGVPLKVAQKWRSGFILEKLAGGLEACKPFIYKPLQLVPREGLEPSTN